METLFVCKNEIMAFHGIFVRSVLMDDASIFLDMARESSRDNILFLFIYNHVSYCYAQQKMTLVKTLNTTYVMYISVNKPKCLVLSSQDVWARQRRFAMIPYNSNLQCWYKFATSP